MAMQRQMVTMMNQMNQMMASKGGQKGSCWNHGVSSAKGVIGPNWTKKGQQAAGKGGTGWNGWSGQMGQWDQWEQWDQWDQWSQWDQRGQGMAGKGGGMASKGGGTTVAAVKPQNPATVKRQSTAAALAAFVATTPGNANCKWCAEGKCRVHQGAPGGNKPMKCPPKERIEALQVQPATPQEVQMFLQLHPGVEQHAVEKLQKTHPKLQRLVLDQGDMSAATDVTAMLMSRLRVVGDLREGDWVCGSCGILQFQKNTQCKGCGSPKLQTW